jgi:elongation factor 1 alpha-like protein
MDSENENGAFSCNHIILCGFDTDSKCTGSFPVHLSKEPCSIHFCAADFFKDTPWLQVPFHRKAEILIKPLYPAGRLLGGASKKPSKLAQLAAARRKKDEEAKSSRGSAKKSPTQQDAGYIDILAKLGQSASLGNMSAGDNGPLDRPSQLRLKENSDFTDDNLDNSTQESVNVRSKSTRLDVEPNEAKPSQSDTQDLQAFPSEFAAAMLGISKRSHTEMTNPPLDERVFSLPLISEREDAEPFSFADPSPDDIISVAQSSRGALQ